MRVECESSKLTPRPLFKERMAGHRWKRQASTAIDRWRRMGPLAIGKGPADPRVRPNPRWPTLLTARAHCPCNGHMLFKLWCWPNFALKRCSNLFFKRFLYSEKFFWIFVKKQKSARKVSSMQGSFENSNMQWEKIKKIEKRQMMKGEYEIRTDLPSARARRLESDERDLSPAVFTTARPVLENWTKTSLRPYATPSLHIFFLIVWS